MAVGRGRRLEKSEIEIDPTQRLSAFRCVQEVRVMEEQSHPGASTGESSRAIEPLARKLRLPPAIGILPGVEVTISAHEAEAMRTSFLERIDSVAYRALLRTVHGERLPRISTTNDCVTVLARRAERMSGAGPS
jgi:hypothetical protein